MLIEAIVQNDAEAVEAQGLGIDRLELVSAISEGGLTPSYGTIKRVLDSVSIPVQIMIRPHSHHFVYNESDLQIMYEDIRSIVDLGRGNAGIVIGALNEDKTINEKVLEEIISIAPELDITFHRAFDEVASQIDAYKTLLKYKQHVKRILTSGGEDNCEAGLDSLVELVKLATETDGPVILPGAGLAPANIEKIHQAVQANQYHFGKALRSEQSFALGFDKGAINKVQEATAL